MAVFTDQFYVIDPGNPPASGTVLSVVNLDVNDVNNNGVISAANRDEIGGVRVTAVWVGDTVTVNVGGVPTLITGVTFYRAGGAPAVFTPTDGSYLNGGIFQGSSFVLTSTQATSGVFGPPACFLRGTRIETPKGLRKIEDLRAGDLVVTRDHGDQPVRWAGFSKVRGVANWAPIRFAPGILGNARALLVSPEHRMLIGGWQSQLYYGEDEVLVAAKHLIDGVNVRRVAREQVDYFHLLFDHHEVIYSEGVASESFHPGDEVMRENAQIRREVIDLFPELADENRLWPTARPVLRGHEAGVLIAA